MNKSEQLQHVEGCAVRGRAASRRVSQDAWQTTTSPLSRIARASASESAREAPSGSANAAPPPVSASAAMDKPVVRCSITPAHPACLQPAAPWSHVPLDDSIHFPGINPVASGATPNDGLSMISGPRRDFAIAARAWPFEEARKLLAAHRAAAKGRPSREQSPVRNRLWTIGPAAYRHLWRSRPYKLGSPGLSRDERSANPAGRIFR